MVVETRVLGGEQRLHHHVRDVLALDEDAALDREAGDRGPVRAPDLRDDVRAVRRELGHLRDADRAGKPIPGAGAETRTRRTGTRRTARAATRRALTGRFSHAGGAWYRLARGGRMSESSPPPVPAPQIPAPHDASVRGRRPDQTRRLPEMGPRRLRRRLRSRHRRHALRAFEREEAHGARVRQDRRSGRRGLHAGRDAGGKEAFRATRDVRRRRPRRQGEARTSRPGSPP